MRTDLELACDMDGVFSDFSGKVAELMGFSLSEGQEISSHPKFEKKKMWRHINEFDAHTPFFYSLNIIPDAYELWDFVTDKFDREKIFFLTASGYTPVDAPHQKRRWIRKNFGAYRVEVVDKSHDKAKFATPNTILIDDREKSIKPWVDAGGIGILHKNAQTTIEELRKILEV
jgi:hypothetical protein